jgi:hypothetical protein
MVTVSKKVIVMDGFLQQTTIDLFSHITNVDTYAIQQNVFKPFTDHTANVYISN